MPLQKHSLWSGTWITNDILEKFLRKSKVRILDSWRNLSRIPLVLHILLHHHSGPFLSTDPTLVTSCDISLWFFFSSSLHCLWVDVMLQCTTQIVEGKFPLVFIISPRYFYLCCCAVFLLLVCIGDFLCFCSGSLFLPGICNYDFFLRVLWFTRKGWKGPYISPIQNKEGTDALWNHE